MTFDTDEPYLMKLYQLLVLSCSLFYLSSAHAQATSEGKVSAPKTTQTPKQKASKTQEASKTQDASKKQEASKTQGSESKEKKAENSVAKKDQQETSSLVQSPQVQSSQVQADLATPKAKVSIGQERRLPNDRVAVQQRAMSREGSIGLHEVKSADVGPQGTLRFGVQVSGFSSDQFLTLGTKERFSRGDFSLSSTRIPAH